MTNDHPTPLQLEREGAIATLIFNRPAALNAIDVPMALALRDAVRGLALDRTLRCVVMKGAGRAFMAGGDLDTLAADPARGAAELLELLNEAVALLAQLDAPVIAQVHGAAAGAGLSLMLQADFVHAAEDTRFNLAYIKLGASCDVGASWALPRMVGLRNALEIAMLGETLTSADAQRLGLINRALPAAELDDSVAQLARRLAAGPTVALGHMRRLMRSGLERNLREQLAAEACAFDACAHTADLPRGIAAFHAKQIPHFEGR
ncbi:MAG: enoyl-CoA hydratase/isomerase family protein [Burkholderiaceae bacterium]|jgi:2-(1,2-epoxy-1,2-dihydrophenyl)acetyl-CoA isomerase|nr:enoyl-CoA hydratase/isomerase family protein [Burkholderiaceae bacterium]